MVEMVWFELAAPTQSYRTAPLDRSDLASALRDVRIGTSA